MLSGGANLLETRFRRLQTAFTKRRVDWLLKRLNEQVFGAVPGDLPGAVSHLVLRERRGEKGERRKEKQPTHC